MTLFHGRWRRRTSLLASGALAGRARAAAEAHAEACAACRRELARTRVALALLDQDPLRAAEPPIPIGSLVTRVHARLDAANGAERRSRGSLAWAGAAALALVAALVLLRAERPGPSPGPPEAETALLVMDDDAVRRLERRVTREQAARYLDDAHDVLVTVAAAPHDCDDEDHHVDVGAEARRSRELLARRALLVDSTSDEVASVRPVLEDVDLMLREVASLPSCARPGELAAIQREVTRRHLLMKIDLMTRELQG